MKTEKERKEERRKRKKGSKKERKYETNLFVTKVAKNGISSFPPQSQI